MSVYTKITHSELQDWLQQYSLGSLESLQPIHGGTVNSNYQITCAGKHYILTLFETLDEQQLHPIFNLLQVLYKNGLACPQTIPCKQGNPLLKLKEKPIAIVEFIPGKQVEKPTVTHCKQVGTWLAQMHLVLQNFMPHIPNTMGGIWQNQTIAKLQPSLASDMKALITEAMVLSQPLFHANLPKGIIHADLFRDNALFLEDKLNGVIDFYFACHDILIYDLAITLNDWCTNQGEQDLLLSQGLLQGYQSVRALTELETAHLPHAMIRAGLRFLLSRLLSAQSTADENVLQKDPAPMAKLLAHYIHAEDWGFLQSA